MNREKDRLVTDFVRRRDESTFRRLYEDITPMIFAMAIKLCGSRSGAEELVQEAWVRTVERIAAFNHNSKFSTWMTGILINCYRESLRRKARFSQLADEPQPHLAEVIKAFPDGQHTPADRLDVDRALSSLAPGFREVVVLHDVYGYTHKEIGSMLGIKVGTSKSQLMRGRAHLRDLLTVNETRDPGRHERGVS